MPSIIWVIIGLVITFLSVTADLLGFSVREDAEFGSLQWTGTIIGIICILVGFVISRPQGKGPTT